ncbi:hypothetical protein CDS [Bradyrhizobium sp.]|nr:hypothetical protein CDS [Bradyrhizobium sp.]
MPYEVQIEQIPYQKRPYALHPVRITVTRLSAIIADQS